jgi:hypothetical protein
MSRNALKRRQKKKARKLSQRLHTMSRRPMSLQLSMRQRLKVAWQMMRGKGQAISLHLPTKISPKKK